VTVEAMRLTEDVETSRPTRSSLPGAGGEAARQWAAALAEWAIPEEILASASESPWALPPAMFAAAARRRPSHDPSTRAAAAALPLGGSVLDVGCGGGAAALALVPPAGRLVGVDQSFAMLEQFALAAEGAGVGHAEVCGNWPDAAAVSVNADVVVCHHVAYNVSDITPFVAALAGRADRRVVMEVTARHPTAGLSPLWERFWGLVRPEQPTAELLVEVVAEAGFRPSVQCWARPGPPVADRLDLPERVAFTRRRLCLTPDRDPEVAAALAELPDEPEEVVTISWDTGSWDTGPERQDTGPERQDTGPERQDTGPERKGAGSGPDAEPGDG